MGRYIVLGMGLLCGGYVFASAPVTSLMAQNVFDYIGQPSKQIKTLVILGGYRLYSTSARQFLKQDAYSPLRDTLTQNGFYYAAGNPVLFIDNSGHTPAERSDERIERQASEYTKSDALPNWEMQVGKRVPRSRSTEKKLKDFWEKRKQFDELKSNMLAEERSAMQRVAEIVKKRQVLQSEGNKSPSATSSEGSALSSLERSTTMLGQEGLPFYRHKGFQEKLDELKLGTKEMAIDYTILPGE